MRSQEAYHYIKTKMKQQFGDQVAVMREESAWDHHGWFRIWFQYQPKEYCILFEGEFQSFCIRILSSGYRYLPLMRIVPYQTNMTRENIQDAIQKLEDCLQQELSFCRIRTRRDSS